MVYKNDEYRQASVAHHIPNATTFDPCDVRGEGLRLDGYETFRFFYDRLKKHNTRRWNGKWRDESFQRKIENVAIYDAIAQQAELTRHQKKRGEWMFESLDLRRYSKFGGVYTAAFCVSVLVSSLDGREYHPTRKDENNDTTFVELANSLGLKTRWLEKALPKVRYELSGYFEEK